jgi:hypothetical protein
MLQASCRISTPLTLHPNELKILLFVGIYSDTVMMEHVL